MIEKVNLRDSYKYYKENSVSPVDVKRYLYIVTGFMKFIMKKVFDGFDVQLSGGRSLGIIGIRGRKIKLQTDENGNAVGLATNWKETNILWANDPGAKERKERIYYLNEHTNGIRYNLRWWRIGMKIGNKRLYYFSFCKPNKRAASALFKAGREYSLS